MHQTRLDSSSRLGETEWLLRRLLPFGTAVTSIVPSGFAAYLRILHPAHGANEESIRWASVAAKSGRTMHRLAQFHAISRPKVELSMDAVTPPEPGNLRSDLLTNLCEVLAQHTNTSESCFFCLWEGYGWLTETQQATVVFTRTDAFRQESVPPRATDHLSPVLRAAVRNAPRVSFPYRNYLLFEGPLEATAELGWRLSEELFISQSPNLFWPQDQAWCVASEIDLFCTLVAGSNELAESLIANSRLEVWRALADDPVGADSDEENR